jgi:hypothetical protein
MDDARRTSSPPHVATAPWRLEGSMPTQLASLLTFYVFSTGRRLFAMQEVKKLATADTFTTLVTHCDVAIEHDLATRVTEARWAGRKTSAQYSPLAKQIDIYVDTAVSALHDGLELEANNSAPDDPLGQQAETLRQTLFPNGVAGVTALNYVDELAEVERILSTVKSAEWAPIITMLGLSRRVARIEALEPQYRSAVADTATALAFSDVKSARMRGQSLLLQIVAIVLGKYPSDNATDLAARAKLLAPIFRQNDAIRDYLRARRPVLDVNPDTGEAEGSPDGATPAETKTE